MQETITRLSQILDLTQFGVEKAKPFLSLVEEIESGESKIIWEVNKPIRLLKVARVKVISLERNKSLYEIKQVFTDGRERQRNIEGLSEKIMKDEKPQNAAFRAIEEELGLNTEYISEPLYPDGEDYEEIESPSYPGLVTRYEFFDFIFYFPDEIWQDGFVEASVDKKTYFAWR